MDSLNILEKNLKIKFQNRQLLKEALTHRSYLNEAGERGLCSNERLEFLGDAILSFVISEWIFKEFPHYPEGNLTSLRSNLVKTESLAKIGKSFNLGKFLFLSKGEKEEGGDKNPTLLANAFEAIIGAIFLDQGIETIKNFIKKNFKNLLKTLVSKGEFKDFKSLFQEKAQAKNRITPHYKVIDEKGPDHAKIFTVGVYLGEKLTAKGIGKNKQEAEENAAKNALKKIK
jgi:ribonuclease-3